VLRYIYTYEIIFVTHFFTISLKLCQSSSPVKHFARTPDVLSCFLTAFTTTFSSCARVFHIEQYGGLVPHFVFPSTLLLSRGYSSQGTCFRNSFWDSVVEHPCYLPSPRFVHYKVNVFIPNVQLQTPLSRNYTIGIIPAIHTKALHGFRRCLQANSGILPSSRLQSLPCSSLPIHH
jgi:hypothetical protein